MPAICSMHVWSKTSAWMNWLPMLGIDRFRLTRQFKQVFGLSPHAYLVRLRLRTARALLASGREPALVAMDVGFADQSHRAAGSSAPTV
ncbi:helix-turn-helix domain-containing protein [Paludibacterium denitrificans]|uniref:helix-turn-helix domain-containing protein n=1 Tax=Paludibacterium denitrificans TaxID=2675226 RepID=UPI001E4DBD85|nr:helix-turn-helix domain-containing protein [Paludibacterium denitrificans]